MWVYDIPPEEFLDTYPDTPTHWTALKPTTVFFNSNQSLKIIYFNIDFTYIYNYGIFVPIRHY